jgi:hypothetical protein
MPRAGQRCSNCVYAVRGEFSTGSPEGVGLRCQAGLPAEWRVVRGTDWCGEYDPAVAVPPAVLLVISSTAVKGGLVVPLGNSSFVELYAVSATWATGQINGQRVPAMLVSDALGNELWLSSQGSNVTSRTTITVEYGAGVDAGRTVAVSSPLPVGFVVPPGSIVTFFDSAAISGDQDFVSARIQMAPVG